MLCFPLALSLLFFSAITSAQMFKCEVAGQITYQQVPCPEGAQTSIASPNRVHPGRSTTAQEDLTVPLDSRYVAAPNIDIDAYCRAEWPDDVEMRQYCRRNEREAESKALRLKRNASPDILSHCYLEWDSWSMRAHCTEQELQAKDDVFKLTMRVSADIRRHCMQKWDTWRMRRYCMREIMD